jgi:hypothetical protein
MQEVFFDPVSTRLTLTVKREQYGQPLTLEIVRVEERMIHHAGDHS